MSAPEPTPSCVPAPAERAAREPRFLSVRQVAEYLQINEKKVYALAGEGRMPGTKVTGKWLFPRDLVDQWLVESSHGGVLADRLVVTGSDDPLLGRVVARIAESVQARALVTYAGTGTGLGLDLLASGRADACAVHWGPAEESERRHAGLLRRHPAHTRWVLVRAFRREQGLMISPAVPEADRDLEALRGPRYRWAFRQEGAGSQRFLRETLARASIDPHTLQRGAEARTEREAAALVAMSRADVAPGVRAAAAESGLAFLPTGWEAFDLALARGIYFRALFQRLLEELRAPATADDAASLGGYDLSEAGALIWSAT